MNFSFSGLYVELMSFNFRGTFECFSSFQSLLSIEYLEDNGWCVVYGCKNIYSYLGSFKSIKRF